MFNNPPIWEHQIAGVLHLTDFKGFLGVTVSMFTGNWEGITPTAIFHCFFCKIVNFLLFFAGNKWVIMVFNPFR
jgi:hypothetical protein